MKPPTIYGSFTVSVVFHLTFLLVAVILIQHTGVTKTAVPYIVSLVDDIPAAGPARGPAKTSETKASPPAKAEAPRAPEKAAVPKEHKAKPDPKARQEDDRRMRERIEALQAKKKIEKMTALRKVIDVDRAKAGVERTPSPSAGHGGTTGGADYYSLIVSKIRQQWVFPETIGKDLEAVVSIRIARDGRVTVEKMEKSSNNALFDRSVLRAIAMASPLPPPAREMEMGVRFKP